ncbi:MAG: hypothetical protein OXJ55_03320 [Caldilineaceae bacterium]|nr:hypothetical protein [Caldilineaceae bacterium]
MGLSLALPLAGSLDSVALLAQRLKVVAVVGAGWQGHNVVGEDGCGDAASFGTVAAQGFGGEDRVVDAAQALVVAGQGGGRAAAWLVGTALRAGDGADAGAHGTCTTFVTGSGSRG